MSNTYLWILIHFFGCECNIRRRAHSAAQLLSHRIIERAQFLKGYLTVRTIVALAAVRASFLVRVEVFSLSPQIFICFSKVRIVLHFVLSLNWCHAMSKTKESLAGYAWWTGKKEAKHNKFVWSGDMQVSWVVRLTTWALQRKREMSVPMSFFASFASPCGRHKTTTLAKKKQSYQCFEIYWSDKENTDIIKFNNTLQQMCF